LELLSPALGSNQIALSEYESKQMLAKRGIPVCREVLARDALSAAKCADEVRYPVVLKACGPRLHHKSDLGGVVLNIQHREEVIAAAEALLRIDGCEALLVQEMVAGARELACGFIRHPHFGPCVMFGLGGVLTEVLEDVTFRLAPLREIDAHEMLHEIRAGKILEGFRGEAPVDLESVTRILVALGHIGIEEEGIGGIDINPLKIQRNGMPVAVDALVILNQSAGDASFAPQTG
jgi:acetyl-CoA synthetase (ADP-forming)